MSPVPFHTLRVAAIVPETADSRSLVFETPERAHRFDYLPGQFLTVRVPGADGPLARCYSLSSSPHRDERLQVTVKRVSGGRASNWICDHVEPGSRIDVLEPAGAFTPRSLDEDLLLAAAGSGITPVLSILTSVLTAGTGRVTLLYANRDENSVIFRDRLDQLARAHPQRFSAVHWLESVQGLPSSDALHELVRPWSFDRAFVCGPRPFMGGVRTALREREFPRSRIHVERFASLGGDPFADARPADELDDLRAT